MSPGESMVLRDYAAVCACLPGGKQDYEANIIAASRAHGISELMTLDRAENSRYSEYTSMLSPDDVIKT